MLNCLWHKITLDLPTDQPVYANTIINLQSRED